MLTAYAQASSVVKVITLDVIILSFALSIGSIILEFRVRTNVLFRCLVILLAMINGSVGMVLYLYSDRTREPMREVYARPSLLFVSISLFIMVVCILRARSIQKYMRRHATITTLKMGMDMLPTGIGVFTQDGVVRMLNYTMERLSLSLTGHTVLNGNDFWYNLNGEGIMQDCHTFYFQDARLLQLSDGTIWSCKREETEEGFFQLTAYDYTEEYNLVHKQEENNAKVEELNQKFREYGGMVDEAVRQEEFLATKIRIHDSLGRVLLSAMGYLNGGSEDAPTLIENWREALKLLLGEANVKDDDFNTVQELVQAAGFLGLQLTVTGRLPSSAVARKLLFAGARECMTNAVRHAHATEMHIELLHVCGRTKIVFTNNGDAPEGDIQEGGGLTSLRTLVKGERAEMKVIGKPVFALIISVFGEENGDEEAGYDSGR